MIWHRSENRIEVRFHELSPLQDRTLVEVTEAVRMLKNSRCEQRWYRVYDALC